MKDEPNAPVVKTAAELVGIEPQAEEGIYHK
jgi:hypothetical protein